MILKCKVNSPSDTTNVKRAKNNPNQPNNTKSWIEEENKRRRKKIKRQPDQNYKTNRNAFFSLNGRRKWEKNKEAADDWDNPDIPWTRENTSSFIKTNQDVFKWGKPYWRDCRRRIQNCVYSHPRGIQTRFFQTLHNSVEFLRALGSQSLVSVWQHTLVV